MNRQKLWKQILVFIPALICTGAAGVLGLIFHDYPVLHLSIDFGSLLILAGILLSSRLLIARFRRTARDKAVQLQLDAVKDENKQFLLRLDHELKNPISTIRTDVAHLEQLCSSGFAHEVDFPEDEMQQTMARITSQSARLNQLISDLRKLAEMETYVLDWASVDIHYLLEQVVEAVRENPYGECRQITLSLPGAPWHLPEIRADEDLLYICLRNVLDNALKYTQPGNSIEVRAHENRHSVQIEIADNGIGIPTEELHKVWGKLYRAQNVRAFPGNGLGLSMVQVIVSRLNGNCELRSRDGEGTVLIMNLPCSPED
ncbi:MAG: HAMP domain-containing histidine kinase [Anaerolineales bacterium]|nr:HAMP domain-containing histidine kinase [Anaerolineales bacterium]